MPLVFVFVLWNLYNNGVRQRDRHSNVCKNGCHESHPTFCLDSSVTLSMSGSHWQLTIWHHMLRLMYGGVVVDHLGRQPADVTQRWKWHRHGETSTNWDGGRTRRAATLLLTYTTGCTRDNPPRTRHGCHCMASIIYYEPALLQRQFTSVVLPRTSTLYRALCASVKSSSSWEEINTGCCGIYGLRQLCKSVVGSSFSFSRDSVDDSKCVSPTSRQARCPLGWIDACYSFWLWNDNTAWKVCSTVKCAMMWRVWCKDCASARGLMALVVEYIIHKYCTKYINIYKNN